MQNPARAFFWVSSKYVHKMLARRLGFRPPDLKSLQMLRSEGDELPARFCIFPTIHEQSGSGLELDTLIWK
jgi:hypothetical protein